MDASFGSGLLQTALHWLPELMPFDEIMESASTARTYTDANSTYEAHLSILASSCDCAWCGPRNREQPSRFCLVGTVETIIVLCRVLATVESIPDLLPHRFGLKVFLELQTSRFHQRMDDKDDRSPFLRVSSRSIAIDDVTALGDVLCLFTGQKLSEENEYFRYAESPAAVSDGGICAYYDTLCEASDNRQLTGKIHVVPGKIEHNDRPYFYLEDRNLSFQYNYHEIDEEDWARMEDRSLLDHVKLGVRESLRTLEVRYEIHDSEGQPVSMNFSPRNLVSKIGQSRGVVSCDPSYHSMGNSIEHLSQTLKDRLATAKIRCKLL